MTDLLKTLKARGFFHQSTEEKQFAALLESGDRITAYVGVDPTADSCHVGHLLPIMGLVHLQQSGHRPVLLMGGGTGRIGDPSGKAEMRQMLGENSVDANVSAIRSQLSRYLDLAEPGVLETEGNQGLVLNNADWILDLNYVDFLRDIGRHFSVNRMLTQDSVKLRLDSDSGLSFLEFNYSLLQAYDFLVLNQRVGCQLQLGGSDQWGNIVAGVDLVRRVEGRTAHGLTFPLITTSSGQKMGKTASGAIWLDPKKTSPYEYYQYWVNSEDADVGRFLRFFTLLPLERIEELDQLKGADIREAKAVLAFEATALTHGREEAEKAQEAAKALFYGKQKGAEVPTYALAKSALEEGIQIPSLFHESGLCESKGAARRMAKQNGLYMHGEVVAADRVVTLDDLRDDAILLRAGKKKHRKIVVE